MGTITNQVSENIKFDDIIMKLKTIEEQQIKTYSITNGLFKYLFNSITMDVDISDSIFKTTNNKSLYVIPHDYDILLNITITGKFDKASLYQYDIVNNVIEFDTLTKEGIIEPFPNGIPILLLGKNLYLSIINKSDDVKIVCKYAYLPDKDRKEVAMYESCSNSFNVSSHKLEHKTGRKYVIHGVNNLGFSPNCLLPIDN